MMQNQYLIFLWLYLILTEQRSLNEYVTLGRTSGTLSAGAILLENLRRGLKLILKSIDFKWAAIHVSFVSRILTFSVGLLRLLGSGALSVEMPSSKCPLCFPSSVNMAKISQIETSRKSSVFAKHLVTTFYSNKTVGNRFRETLSMRELDGFFWKAVLASVLRARNSRTSSLLAASGMAQSFCKSVEKQGVKETGSRVLYKSHISSVNS